MSPSKSPAQTAFGLTKPCGNCPFLKEGAIHLEPGRLHGIVQSLVADDHSTFQCHKTVHSKKGGRWDDAGVYRASGHESSCAGALIYLEKVGRPNIQMRLGMMLGAYDPERLKSHFDAVIEPIEGIHA